MSSRLVVVGPTASGKSDLALRLARELGDAEVLCVDSMTVYRGMDIGTAKASPEERESITHHGLDLVDPDVDFSVAEFQRYADAVAERVAARGKRLVLVGGTGLYVDAVVNRFTMPSRFPEVRAALLAEHASDGVAALYARLVGLDPEAAAKMEPTNDRRIIRALEVCIGSGRRFSSFGPGLQATRSDPHDDSAPVIVGILWPREELRRRIERRFAEQIERGFVEEAAGLRLAFGGAISRTARQALGYRELWEYLDGLSTLEDAIEQAVVRTRQFAVRQERWFRRDPRIRWITADEARTIGADELLKAR